MKRERVKRERVKRERVKRERVTRERLKRGRVKRERVKRERVPKNGKRNLSKVSFTVFGPPHYKVSFTVFLPPHYRVQKKSKRNFFRDVDGGGGGEGRNRPKSLPGERSCGKNHYPGPGKFSGTVPGVRGRRFTKKQCTVFFRPLYLPVS